MWKTLLFHGHSSYMTATKPWFFLIKERWFLGPWIFLKPLLILIGPIFLTYSSFHDNWGHFFSPLFTGVTHSNWSVRNFFKKQRWKLSHFPSHLFLLFFSVLSTVNSLKNFCHLSFRFLTKYVLFMPHYIPFILDA